MQPQNASPNFVAVLEELDAGYFNQRISAALAATAVAVVNNENKAKTGSVIIELKLSRIGEGAQIRMGHRLSYKSPTKRGYVSESDETETLLYVGRGGKMTVTPDTQMDLIAKQPREVV